MNRDDVIRWAREAAIPYDPWPDSAYNKNIERFAALVAAASASVEREACAKLVEPDEEHRRDAAWGYLGGKEGVELLDSCAAAIRARRDEVTYGETTSRGQA